jgi:hypothetical protein
MAAADPTSRSERCSWCGSKVEPGDGFRVREHPGERVAVFCRLEHVVPWAMQGAHWTPDEAAGGERTAGNCAQCDAPLDDVVIQVVRHRGEHRIPDAFCSVDHLAAWARAGGRWA